MAPGELPWGERLEWMGLALWPVVALVWMVGGIWLAAVRYRHGEGTRRWLVPVAVPGVAHAVWMTVVNLAA